MSTQLDADNTTQVHNFERSRVPLEDWEVSTND